MKVGKLDKGAISRLIEFGRRNLPPRAINGGLFWSEDQLGRTIGSCQSLCIVAKSGSHIIGCMMLTLNHDLGEAVCTYFRLEDAYWGKGVPQQFFAEAKEHLSRSGIIRLAMVFDSETFDRRRVLIARWFRDGFTYALVGCGVKPNREPEEE